MLLCLLKKLVFKLFNTHLAGLSFVPTKPIGPCCLVSESSVYNTQLINILFNERITQNSNIESHLFGIIVYRVSSIGIIYLLFKMFAFSYKISLLNQCQVIIFM